MGTSGASSVRKFRGPMAGWNKSASKLRFGSAWAFWAAAGVVATTVARIAKIEERDVRVRLVKRRVDLIRWCQDSPGHAAKSILAATRGGRGRARQPGPPVSCSK